MFNKKKEEKVKEAVKAPIVVNEVQDVSEPIVEEVEEQKTESVKAVDPVEETEEQEATELTEEEVKYSLNKLFQEIAAIKHHLRLDFY